MCLCVAEDQRDFLVSQRDHTQRFQLRLGGASELDCFLCCLCVAQWGNESVISACDPAGRGPFGVDQAVLILPCEGLRSLVSA